MIPGLQTARRFKAYYGAIYHAQYDTTALRTGAMNYPFGEVITFTDSQPLLVNMIRLLSPVFPGLPAYTVAVINLAMLLALIAGVLFVYLLFCEAGTVWWYAAPVSLGIILLSPQISRMGGHFALSWLVWIPLMLWLIVRFDKTRHLVYSLVIGLVSFLSGFMHIYFLAFMGILLAGYWFFRFFWYRKAGTFWYRDVMHIFVQFVLPVLLIQFLMFINDDVIDRPGWPFGFWSNVTHPVALLFPSGAPWGFVPQLLTVFRHISWEAWAYIGTPAAVGFWVGLGMTIKRLWTRENAHRVIHVGIINILFWVSVIILLFSAGIPFVFRNERAGILHRTFTTAKSTGTVFLDIFSI
jgi:hypothetical protein